MTILNKIKAVFSVILVSSISFMGVIILAFQNGELKTEIINQNKLLETAHNELYLKNIESGKIDLSLQHLKKINPKAYKQYEEFYNNETE
jgi:hypothetical protein